MSCARPLRVGYVPEHFSTPLHFAAKHFGLQAELKPFPSGTGHMILALRAGEIDVGIGLTEGWIAGLGKADAPGDGGYRLVGTYVETPLCWAISTGAKRDDILSVASLQGKRIGVSRIGSGSFVMGWVLAEQQGWLSSSSSPGDKAASPFADFVVCHTLDQLRQAVNLEGDTHADFFLWEHFTTKKHYDNGELRRVGEIYTPWSSWKIVAATELVGEGAGAGGLDARVEELCEKLDLGIQHFRQNQDEAVDYISSQLDYSVEDARAWLDTVKFPDTTMGVDIKVAEKTVATLVKSGVLEQGKGLQAAAMIARQR